jgi:alpha-galactosidase
MGGALGLCFWDFGFSATELAEIAREIAIYKEVRMTLSVAAAALLSPQVNQEDTPDWDVMQATAPGNDALVIYAYQNSTGAEKVNVKPMGLQPGATYAVSSVDVGYLGAATGTDLMTNGIDVVESKATAAHILQLVAN